MDEEDIKNIEDLQEFYETETDAIKLTRVMYNENMLNYYTEKNPQKKQGHKNEAHKMIGEFLQEEFHIKTIIKPATEPIWIYEDGIYTRNSMPAMRNFLLQALRERYSQRILLRALELTIPKTYIHEDDFEEKNKNLMCVENGILNISTKKLSPHTPKKIFLSKIPTTFDKKQTSNEIIELFKEYLPQQDKLDTLQEMFGYCLYRDYPIHELFILIGEGRNGKGTILSILEKMLGEKNVSHKTLQQLAVDGRSFAVASLHSKLANIGGDIPSTKIQSTAMLKQLSGGDIISAEIKGVQDPINFRNYAKLIFSCNEMPSWSDDSFGWNSRVRPIILEKKFLKRKELIEIQNKENDEEVEAAIQNLSEKICTKNNLSSLLNWSLTGLSRLLKNGEFSDTNTMAERQRILELSSTPFTVFAKENLVESFGHEISKEKMRKEYQRFCKHWRVVAKNSDKSIKRILDKFFAVQVKSIREGDSRIRVWSGVNFKVSTLDNKIDSSQNRL